MDYIFASSTTPTLDVAPLTIDEKQFIEPARYKNCIFQRRVITGERRLVDYYNWEQGQTSLEQQAEDFSEPPPTSPVSSCRVAHGYIFGEPNLHQVDPRCNHYGVYSHGTITDSLCEFATDEIGLSPLYYSECGSYLFVSNNPHLIALYRKKLGFPIEPEPTLPVWHTIGITVESDHTGYAGIKRVRPWEYLQINHNQVLGTLQKTRLFVNSSYEAALDTCIEMLRNAVEYIADTHTDLRAQLTGGLDSRLVLAFILDRNLENRFVFSTQGKHKNPDRIIAKMIAKRYRLRHRRYIERPFNKGRSTDEAIRSFCLDNAMESTLVRLDGRQDHRFSNTAVLNGFGAVFSKSLWYSSMFKKYMEKRFPEQSINYDLMTDEQLNYAPRCFGLSKEDIFYLTPYATNIALDNRAYIFNFTHRRFPENMNYADSMGAYRYRNHNANLSTRDCNQVVLYCPHLIETSRMLSPELRQEGKSFFDILWHLNRELSLFPLENRIYSPLVYENLSPSEKELVQDVEAVNGPITSNAQIHLYNSLRPSLKKFPDNLPQSVFAYIKEESLVEISKQDNSFGKHVFAPINLYGIAIWHKLIEEMNNLCSSSITGAIPVISQT